MFKTIAIIVVVAIAAVLVYAATRPDTLVVQRSTTIKAPPEKIYAYINDFQQWRNWSPYENMDPAMIGRDFEAGLAKLKAAAEK